MNLSSLAGLALLASCLVAAAACDEGVAFEDDGGGASGPSSGVGAGATSSSGDGGNGAGGMGGGANAGGSGGAGGGECVGSSTIVINEVRYDAPSNDAANEWIELHNKSGNSIDVSGWQIKTGTSSYVLKFTFPASTTLDAGDYVTIGGSESMTTDFQAKIALNMGNTADGSCDALRLLTDDGVVVDTVIYGDMNDDLWMDDCGNVATTFVAAGFNSETIARSPNGSDTNDSVAPDFVRYSNDDITMGAANP
jgi:hypothetical protein